MTLGNKIQSIRTAYGMSQEQFGEVLNTSRQTVSKWELDQVIPDIRKIVAISRFFCVSTDSLLLDVTTFAEEGERFLCGVYRGKNIEIVETERVALIYYCNEDKSVMGAKAYIGYGKQKTCKAVCERDIIREITRYAFENKDGEFIYNEESLTEVLSELFSREQLSRMNCIDKFYVNHGEIEMPSVDEAGIKRCLTLWQMGTEYHVGKDYFTIVLNTSQTEYNFNIAEENTDIYCGIMYMQAFDLGIQSFGQFFRLRNQGDNSQRYCRFYCDFTYEKPNVQFHTNDVALGNCVAIGNDYIWFVKRYSNEEIVLQGCAEEEYIYRKDGIKLERYAMDSLLSASHKRVLDLER